MRRLEQTTLEAESRAVLARSWGWGWAGRCVLGLEFQPHKRKSFQEVLAAMAAQATVFDAAELYTSQSLGG